MVKIFISAHGRFASGIKSSMGILWGNTENITAFDAYVDERSIKDELDAFYRTVAPEDQVFLLSDINNGSVNQTMYRYKDRPNTVIITGINLMLILELVSRDRISPQDLDEIISDSRAMLRVVKEEKQKSAEDTDFF